MPKQKEKPAVSAIVDHPSFYALPPKDQLFVELVRGSMAFHGKIAPDVAKELANTARAAAKEMGWE